MLIDREKIVRLREAKGLGMNELARRAGIRGPSLHAIEKGKTKSVRASTLLGIANALGVPMQELIKHAQKNDPNVDSRAMTMFSQLAPRDKLAILGAIEALASPKKPT